MIAKITIFRESNPKQVILECLVPMHEKFFVNWPTPVMEGDEKLPNRAYYGFELNPIVEGETENEFRERKLKEAELCQREE